MTDSIIRLLGVSKSYGTGEQAAIALDCIDLEVTRGEFVSLMGPSGSGKTTLLNMIAGLDVPDGGCVLLDGVDLSTLADHQLAHLRLRTIGFVFQAFNLIPALTVEENVSWPLEFSGYVRSEVRARTAEALRHVAIDQRHGNPQLETLLIQRQLAAENRHVKLAVAVGEGYEFFDVNRLCHSSPATATRRTNHLPSRTNHF